MSHPEAVRGNSRTSKAPVSEIETAMKAWLKNAPRRCYIDDKPAQSDSRRRAASLTLAHLQLLIRLIILQWLVESECAMAILLQWLTHLMNHSISERFPNH